MTEAYEEVQNLARSLEEELLAYKHTNLEQ
jgi:hypothetical protein